MWMIEPKLMCRKHLLGEHLELHMLLSSIKKGKKLDGFIDKRIIEPINIYYRHFLIVEEMNRIGFNHKTDIDQIEWLYIAADIILKDEKLYHATVDKNKSISDLTFRCKQCSINIIGKYYGK
jgi:hypothetical protein